MLEFIGLIKFCFRNKRFLLKFFPTFLDNIKVYLFNKKANKGPLFAIWDITDACNCRCIYCDHWKNPKSYTELEIEKKLDIVNRLAEAGVGGLSLHGGEPLWVEGTDR